MKFSIIVPVYNAADFVADTIDNLLKQNVDKEIIIVNDGSTDKSLEILRKYEKKYPCIKVFDKPNGGVASARNVGILNASGDFISFVDSDDFINEDTLEKCEKFILENNIDVVVFTYRLCFPLKNEVKDVSELYKTTGLYTLREWIGDYWTLDNLHIMHCIGTKIYKKDIIFAYKLLFDEKTDYCEDIGFCTTYMSYVNNLYYINEPLYQYRMFNENNRISKFKPHLFLSKEYLHNQQIKMFSHIFTDGIIYADILKKIYEKDIEECLKNIFEFKDVDNNEKSQELSHMSDFLATNKSINGDTLLQKFYIYILRNHETRIQAIIFQLWFRIYGVFMYYIGKYYYRVKYKLIRYYDNKV